MSDSIPLFWDPSHSSRERLQDLISRLTLPEKIGLMTHDAQGVPRLGIPAYNYWSEALHGVARNGRATVFPQAIGMAASWDPNLLQRIGSAIGDEGRAKYHATLRQKGSTSIYQGLSFWSPNINIFRDPRWGRGQETYGEDPYLTGELGVAFVRGLQGDDSQYLKGAACAKHYAVHSGPEALRHQFNASPSLRELNDTYLPAFKKLVKEANVEAVMGAYNAVYGVPCNASEFLLNQILRQEWGFQGHVVSDCGAITNIYQNHKYMQDAAEASAKAVKAGCDLFCEFFYAENIDEAIERGLLSEADLDTALTRTLGTCFKLGLFDPEAQVPYASTPIDVVGCADHRQLAYEAAVKSIVLLKNKGGALPIAPDTFSIMVIGPNAATLNVLLGNYYGFNDRMTTMLEGIAGALPEGMRLEYHQGTSLTESGANPNNWAFDMAANAGLTIACMGISPLLEGEEGEALLAQEGGDRTAIELPESQMEFLRKLHQRGARLVLVLFGGGPIALGEAEEFAEAILHVWYPGQEGGRAVADVLFGKAVPSGRLPVTFPRATSQLPPFEDYSMKERTYRYATWEPLYPFGFGLSYTTFSYLDLKLEKPVLGAGESLGFSVRLSNTGNRSGEEVVQVYLSDLEASTLVPNHKLVAFRRVELAAEETRELHFTLSSESLQFINEKGKAVLEPGAFRLQVGGCSPGQRGMVLGTPEPVCAEFQVAG